ncbi:hypothetical protein [Sphingomonas sp. DT-204]|uniref:hypothetical protein n=1 Tax=Sphingomonas sp. DT-204 TaxID=3396166 RepID=UPI003F1C4C79
MSLIAAPALANPAARLSVAKASQVRASSPADKASHLASGVWIGLAAVAIIAGIVIIADDDDDADSN